MNTVTFDTAKFQKKLIEADVDPKQAEAQTEVMADALSLNVDKLATKEQVDARFLATKAQMEAFNMRFDDQKEFFITKFNDQKEFLRQEIDTAITRGVSKLQSTLMYWGLGITMLLIAIQSNLFASLFIK